MKRYIIALLLLSYLTGQSQNTVGESKEYTLSNIGDYQYSPASNYGEYDMAVVFGDGYLSGYYFDGDLCVKYIFIPLNQDNSTYYKLYYAMVREYPIHSEDKFYDDNSVGTIEYEDGQWRVKFVNY